MQVFLTIDVESASGDYNRDVYGSGHGLAYLLASLSRHGVKATFFVEAMDGTRGATDNLAETCRLILEAGQDVQLHLHPEMAKLDGIHNTDGVLWRHNLTGQIRLMTVGRDILQTTTGTMPIAFRAGSLTANTDTLLAMRECGLMLGSNRDLDTHSSIESRLNDVFQVINDISEFSGVTDIPVSSFLSPFPRLDGQWRHLEPCALSLGEMTGALGKMAGAGYQTACLLTHTHEFYYRRGHTFHINWINRRRWEGVLKHLTQAPWAQLSTFSSTTQQLNNSTPNSPPPIRLNPAWSLLRLAEQALKRAHGISR